MLFESRVQWIEHLDLRVPAPLLELVADEFGVRLVVGRAHLIRLRGQILHPRAQVRGTQITVEKLLQRALLQGLIGRKAEEPARRSRRGRACNSERGNYEHQGPSETMIH